jgi:tetratricopeptide (TPR) repeat protein
MLDARSALQRLGLAAALLALAGPPAHARDCAPWPGEPHPLPRVGDGSPLLARWAQLRAQELARYAEAIEANTPVAAYRVWQHVLCLAPGDEAARSGALRSQPLRIHRPEVAVGPAVAGSEPDTDLWRSLDAPVPLAARAPAPARAGSEAGAVGRGGSLSQIDRALAAAEAQLAAARFEQALATAARARAGLDALPPGRALAPRQLRLELIEATAEAARGRDEAARACFARVLALDPGFALDARTTSPKLMRLLDAARAETGAPR